MPDQTPSLATNEITYNLDLVTGQILWGDVLYSLCGYDRSEPTQTLEWWTDHIHPEDAMILNKALDGVFNPAVKEWTVTYRFRLADNSYVAMRDHADVTRDAEERAIRLTGSLAPARQ